MTSPTFPNVEIVGQEHLPSKSQQHLPSISPQNSPINDDSPDEETNVKITYVKRESPEEYERNIRKRIEMVLKLASAGGEPITYHQYEMAVLQQPRKGSEVLLRRDIDEIFVNNYNQEWIVAWDANLDISPVYDYFGIITYITDYFMKVIVFVVVVAVEIVVLIDLRLLETWPHQSFLIGPFFRTALD